MADLRRVTYCGFYCGLCALGARVPAQARTLRDSLRDAECETWGPTVPGYAEFWRFLGDLAESGPDRSCREGNCGPPFCAIRKCAPARGVDVCPFCDEYPCGRILELAKGYAMLLADGQRMKDVGLDQWIAEQEKRQATGFSYVDILCQPCHIPDK